MITITKGKPEENLLEKFTFVFAYSDGKKLNVFIEAKNIMAAWATVGESQHMFAFDIINKANLVAIELEKIGEHTVDIE